MDKIIYFDFDGTLHETALIYQKALQAAYDMLRGRVALPERRFSLEEASVWLGYSPPEMWEKFMPELEPKLKKEASQWIGQLMSQAIEMGEGRLYVGTEAVLQKLKQKGYRLKILSNCKESYRDAVVKAFQLDRYFDAFIAAETYGYLPKEEILKLVEDLNQEDSKAKIAAFIGDRKADIDAASANQLFSIGCLYGYGELEELKAANALIHDIGELLDYF